MVRICKGHDKRSPEICQHRPGKFSLNEKSASSAGEKAPLFWTIRLGLFRFELFLDVRENRLGRFVGQLLESALVDDFAEAGHDRHARV